MFYDVLINYCGLDPDEPLWSKLSCVRNFQRVIYLFKKQINSHEYFIYVRRIPDYKQSKIVNPSFKLISKVSYTFAHYPNIKDYINKYLCDKFDNSDIFNYRSL